MKLDESCELQEKSHREAESIRAKKGHDYAKPDADCLSNFKVMSELAIVLEKNGYKIDVTKPHGVAFWHLLHKIVRILNLWEEERQPENESLRDSHIDIDNYNYLAEHCYIDYMRKKASAETEKETI